MARVVKMVDSAVFCACFGVRFTVWLGFMVVVDSTPLRGHGLDNGGYNNAEMILPPHLSP